MSQKESSVVTKSFVPFEHQHIMPIPENERNGTNRSNIAIWISLNMMPLTVVAGAIASGAYGLPISWSIVAILIGNTIGAFGAALHAAQGPRLGIPQMLQARAQFGYLGGSLFAMIAFVMFIGFFAGILIVAKDSIELVLPGINGSFAIATFAIIGNWHMHLMSLTTQGICLKTQALKLLFGALILGSPVALYS